MSNTPNDTAEFKVRHKTGACSTLEFKNYDQSADELSGKGMALVYVDTKQRGGSAIDYDRELSAVMPDDFKDWWDSPRERPQIAAGVITSLREREDLAWAQAGKAYRRGFADGLSSARQPMWQEPFGYVRREEALRRLREDGVGAGVMVYDDPSPDRAPVYLALSAPDAPKDVLRDAERLDWLWRDSGIEGFIGVEGDIHDFAMNEANDNGRDEPNADDYNAGFRKLIDAAMAKEGTQ